MNTVPYVLNPVKYHPVNDNQGYAVEKVEDTYFVVFAEKGMYEGKSVLIKNGISCIKGKVHSYSSVFKADYAIRTEILPLYKRVGK